ncbi:hypothetical protein niasHS_002880 [Heterodera schachtii]|uniref:Regulatory protein zeste n=1 Tax=Heterodera schachtii TaxID=97005 RepID=A0ABD2K921_HETSC
MTSSQNSILDGANLLGNLEFLNSLNEGRNLLHTQLAQKQQQQHHSSSFCQSPFPLKQPKMEHKLDIFAQLQQLVSSSSSTNGTNGCSNSTDHQHLASSFPKQHTASMHNKMLSREKKKFSSDVSDFLVLEVLKRKELLVENNTSRDLSFSECKRNAWNDVRELLVSRFPGFDLNIEAIKSHWRYRKRKVTDAFSEMCKGSEAEQKLKLRLAAVDFEIYSQLKDSNLLERTRLEKDASPDQCDDGHFESISSSNSPATRAIINAESSAPGASSISLAPTLPMISQAPFFLGQLGPQQQQHIGTTNPTMLLERLTASLLEQQLKQQQQQHFTKKDVEEEANDQPEHRGRETDQIVDEHDGIVSIGERRSQSASTTMSNLSSTIMPTAAEYHHVGNAAKENGGGTGAGVEPRAPKRLRLGSAENEEERGMALLKREAYMAQASAFDEIRSLVTEVRSTLLPQMLTALQNYNSQFNS